MKTSLFYFKLPPELIAQEPAKTRGRSRLMHIRRSDGKITHREFKDIEHLLKPGSLLVLNNTRVRRARIFGISEKTGSRVEFLLLKETEKGLWLCMTSKSRKQKIGKRYLFPGNQRGMIINEQDSLKIIHFEPLLTEEYLNNHGHMPLPPYIRRSDCAEDTERYQTVYSKETGSAAAPTAGLHFTENILKKLSEKDIEIKYITLHVGPGTFNPVRSENIQDHKMHAEEYFISEDTAAAVAGAKKENRSIIGVGTTVVRALEASWDGKVLQTGWNKTDIFIYPPYKFKLIKSMITNFHTPESTLLMLVSAFGGMELIKQAYEEAVNERYRFFSYGDSMLID